MPAPSSEPLTRFSLNLFAEDLAWFKRRYGRGFSEEIRRTLHECVEEYRKYERLMPPKPEHYLEEDFDE